MWLGLSLRSCNFGEKSFLKDPIMMGNATLRFSIALFVFGCLPASLSAHQRLVRLCIALPSGGEAFSQIGQYELTNSLLAKQKAAIFIVPVKLKALSGPDAFVEAGGNHCEYVVLTEISLKEFSTWSRPVMQTGWFWNAPYLRIQMEYKLYRLDDLESVGSGSAVVDGLNHIQDVVYNATDHLSRTILKDVNTAGMKRLNPKPK